MVRDQTAPVVQRAYPEDTYKQYTCIRTYMVSATKRRQTKRRRDKTSTGTKRRCDETPTKTIDKDRKHRQNVDKHRQS